MKRPRLVGGDVEAWNAASKPKRALGLALGLLISGLPLVLIVLLAIFLITRPS